jgi:pentatricopeptide repeat protein
VSIIFFESEYFLKKFKLNKYLKFEKFIFFIIFKKFSNKQKMKSIFNLGFKRIMMKNKYFKNIIFNDSPKYPSCFNELLKEEKIEEAENLLKKEINNENYINATYLIQDIIFYHFVNKNLEKAEHFIYLMKKNDFILSIFTYNNLIKGYLDLDMPLKAKKSLEEMEIKKIKPNELTFVFFLNHNLKQEKLEESYLHFKLLERENITATALSFNSFLNYAFTKKDSALFFEYIKIMKAYGIEKDEYTCILIGEFERNNFFNQD